MITESDSRRLPEGILKALGEGSKTNGEFCYILPMHLSECFMFQPFSDNPPQEKTKKVKIARTKSSTEEDSPIKESNTKKSKKYGKFIKTAGGVFLEEPITPPKPKRKVLEIMKTRAGIVRVESLTPERALSTDTSFREEDKTPKAIGFKIRQILSAGQRGGIPKLEVTKKSSKRKKAIFEEPSNLLPKPNWKRTEDVSAAVPKIVAKTSSTQFSVAKVNHNTLGVNLNALNFKSNALFNNDKIRRESSKDIIARKRKL